MKTLKDRKVEARKLVTTLNSSGPNFFCPYPIGNPELNKRVKELEQELLITYVKHTGLWKVGN